MFCLQAATKLYPPKKVISSLSVRCENRSCPGEYFQAAYKTASTQSHFHPFILICLLFIQIVCLDKYFTHVFLLLPYRFYSIIFQHFFILRKNYYKRCGEEDFFGARKNGKNDAITTIHFIYNFFSSCLV